MRLLIDDAFATAAYTAPIAVGWIAPAADIATEIVARLTADQVSPDTAALLPVGILPHLLPTHVVVPEIAVIADGQGDIAMRVPVRPDEIEQTPIRLLDTSANARLLAQATLTPFYGITPTAWVERGDDPLAAQAEVVIVEGAEALREPEGGFSEDLCRAWFILHAQPVVTHVLAMPRDLPDRERQALTAFLRQVRHEALERRKEWRPDYAARQGVSSGSAGAFWAAQRYELLPGDRTALITLLQRGGGLPRQHAPGMLFASDLP